MRACACSLAAIATYRRHLSGPLLDRIDLHVEVPRLGIRELLTTAPAERSSVLSERVAGARARQRERAASGAGAATNAALPERAVRELVPLDRAGERAIGAAVERLGLSARAYVRVLRVARTIADLEAARTVALPHVLEALQYRAFEGKASS